MTTNSIGHGVTRFILISITMCALVPALATSLWLMNARAAPVDERVKNSNSRDYQRVDRPLVNKPQPVDKTLRLRFATEHQIAPNSNLSGPGKPTSSGWTQTRSSGYSPYRSSQVMPVHSPKAMDLIQQLRSGPGKDESREVQIEELRELLQGEFQAMHEAQANEIKQTEKRLDQLKTLHEKRGDNRRKIVQRRIDELLGNQDGLQWNVMPTAPTHPIRPVTEFLLQSKRVDDPVSRSRFESSQARAAKDARASALGKPPTFPTMESQIPTAPRSPERQPAGMANSNDPTKRTIQNHTRVENRNNSQQQRLQATTEVTKSIFEIASQVAALATDLKAAEVLRAQASELHERKAVPAHELQKTELQVQKLKQAIMLHQLQVEEFKKTMDRERTFTRDKLEAAKKALDLVLKRHAQGVIAEHEVNQARTTVANAEHEYDVAEAHVEQLLRVIKIMGHSPAALPRDGDGSVGASGDHTLDAKGHTLDAKGHTLDAKGEGSLNAHDSGAFADDLGSLTPDDTRSKKDSSN